MMFIRSLFFFLCLGIGLLVVSQPKASDFQINFNIAKQYLSQRKVLKALPYLNYLKEHQPENHNLNYLIGLCYVEAKIVNPLAISLLRAATVKASLDYNPNSIEETRVPIYVHYYLSLAYAQHGMCKQAEQSRNDFLKVYPYEDLYYVNTSSQFITDCGSHDGELKYDSIPTFSAFEPFVFKKQESKETIEFEDTARTNSYPEIVKEIKKPKKLKTKYQEYSTNLPIYGVQIGAFNEPIPVSRFKQMKNVDAFADREGLIRYVIGHFSIKSQAKKLLESIQEKEFKDAFVVNINDTKKFSNEIVSVNDVSIKANSSSKIEYSVQIGAFKEEISKAQLAYYFNIEGVEEYFEDGMTYLTVGRFKTYEEAKVRQHMILESGIKDAFIAVFSNRKKISVYQLNEFK